MLPIKNFNEVDLPESLLDRLKEINFMEPTPIQAQAIPAAIAGRDVLGSAQTGTGKTGAFGIPLISHMIRNDDSKALILVPTRELALQVIQALQTFIGKDKIATSLLIGGEPIGKQFKQLRGRPRLVVGTPGRVNDHIKRRTLDLADTNFLILDEVDRMLDMGFSVQLETIESELPSERQTLMFSATMPKNMDNIASKYLSNPVRISVGSTRAAAPKVKQEFIKVRDEEKYDRLLQELETREGTILIFIKTKHNADNMAKKLNKEGHTVEAIHGDLKQSRRSRVIKGFKAKEYRILVATDVAARGLDIPHIEHVINYDAPHNPEDYIHRIGRTGRAGAEGQAINFMSNRDARPWFAVQRLLAPDDEQKAFTIHPKGKKKRTYDDQKKKRKYVGDDKRTARYGDKKRDDDSGAEKKHGDKPFAKRKPFKKKTGDFEDRPKRSFKKRDDGDRNDRPKKDFKARDDRPKRDFKDKDDRPKRDFKSDGDRNDRPKRDFKKDGERSARPKKDGERGGKKPFSGKASGKNKASRRIQGRS